MTSHPANEEDIFLAALEQATPEERAEYVDRACAGDAELRRRVLELLKSHDESQGPFDVPPPGLQPTQTYEPELSGVGDQIGPYKLLEQIGEGGFGIVYMAEQHQPVRRKVALKIIKPGMDTRQVLVRFEAERQALAMMDHPNIARALDAGATDSGRPYFVMELVRGISITDYCDQNNLAVHERLGLFASVCHAVQHAHQKGIIHRDIKPSNVLVTIQDDRPVPKVIDFGVAKAVNQQLTPETILTRLAEMIGTPLYMSPEQAEMTGLDIDTRTDIYSLGVLLYELLTGTTPFDRHRLRQAAHTEICRMIREEEPPKPSSRISTLGEKSAIVAAHRHADPRRLGQLVRGDLDWIVMKALEKDRTRRYETANGLAMEIQRYLANEPVLASPPSAAYRFRKFARRNRASLAMAALVTVALFLGIVGTTWQAIRATHERNRAVDAEQRAQKLLVSERKAREAEAEQRREAEIQRHQADANFRKARAAVDEYFTLVSENKLLDVPSLQALRKQLLEAALRYYQEFSQQKSDSPQMLAELAASYLRVAVIDNVIDRNNDAVVALDQALTLVERLRREHPASAEHHRRLAGFWSGYRQTRISTQLPRDAEKADRTLEQLVHCWEAFVKENPTVSGFQSDLMGFYGLRASLLASLGRYDESLSFIEQMRLVGERLVRENPTNVEYRVALAMAYQYLTDAMRAIGRTQEADGFAQQALALREQAAVDPASAPQHRLDFATQLYLSGRLAREGDPPQAEATIRRAIEILQKLVEESPEVPLYVQRLANAQRRLAQYLQPTGRLAEAESLMRQVFEHRARLVVELSYGDPKGYASDFSQIVLELADLLNASDRPEEARKVLENGIEVLNKRISSTAPDQASFEGQQATACLLVEQARLFEKVGDLRRAESALRQGIALVEKLTTDGSEGPTRELFDALYQSLARTLLATGRAEEARALYRRGAAEMDRLASEFPHHLWAREAVGHHQRLLAFSMSDTEQAQDKEQAFRAAIDVFAQLAAGSRAPKTAHYLSFLGDTHLSLGSVFASNNRWDEAVDAYRKAVEAFQKAVAISPDANGRSQLANGLKSLGFALKNAGRPAEAEQSFRETIARNEKLVTDTPANSDYRFQLGYSYRNLAQLMSETGQPVESTKLFRQALACFEKLAADVPTNDTYRVELGHTLWHLGDTCANAGRVDDAAAELRRSVDVFSQASKDFPNNSFCRFETGFSHWKLGWLMRSAGRHAEAELNFREALPVYRALSADSPDDRECRNRWKRSYHELIETLLAQKKYADAAELSDALVRDFPEDWESVIRSSDYLSRCAVLAAADEAVGNSERSNAFERFRSRSRELFEAASPHVTDAWTFNNYAWRIVVATSPNPADTAFAIDITQRALAKEPDNAYFWNTLGVAQYRRGQWQEAIDSLQKSMHLSDGQYFGADAFFLTMAHWQSGDQQQARRWHTLARQWTDKYAANNDEISGFRAEADALLGPAETGSPDPQTAPVDGGTIFSGILEEVPELAWAYSRRGQEYAEQARWDEAAADLAKAVEIRRDRVFDWYRLSLVHLARHADQQYREICAAMLDEFARTENIQAAHYVAWSCAVGPDAVVDFTPVVALAEKVVATDPKSARFAEVLGAVLYRAGQFDQARQKLEAAAELYSSADASGASAVYTSYFLAMTQHQLKDADQANEWFDKTQQETDKALLANQDGTAKLPWNRMLTLTLLREEAEVMMRMPPFAAEPRQVQIQ